MTTIAFDRRFPQVLVAAREGDEAAWRELYLELAPPVSGYLRYRGALDVEGLTSEVFLQMVRDLDRFTGGERQFRAWALSIARHRLLDDARRRGRRPVEVATADTRLDTVVAGDVETEALERLATDDVLRAIAGLSRDQQDVLVLRLVGDLTVAEIAVAIGKRPGAVKALQRRGLQALARSVGDPPD